MPRTPGWAKVAALLVTALLVVAWPEVLGHVLSADGHIDNLRLAYLLRWLTALGLLALVAGLRLARQSATPTAFVRGVWARRWRVVGGLAGVVAVGALGTLGWAWYANRVPLADEAGVVRALQAKRTDWPLPPILVWLEDPNAATARHQLRTAGGTGTIVFLEAPSDHSTDVPVSASGAVTSRY